MTIILFIFMSDIFFFCVCLMRDVLLLLSTILYDLWVKLYEYLMGEDVKKHIKKHGHQ